MADTGRVTSGEQATLGTLKALSSSPLPQVSSSLAGLERIVLGTSGHGVSQKSFIVAHKLHFVEHWGLASSLIPTRATSPHPFIRGFLRRGRT